MGIQKYGSYKSLIFTRWESEIKLIHIEKQYFMKKNGFIFVNFEDLPILNVKGKQKNTSLLRKILTVSVVLCFVFFLLVFIQQYFQYKRIEDRLTAAYSTSYNQSSGTYKLLTTYGEVDNLFRLYTVDYDERAYDAYKIKLDTLKIQIGRAHV